MMRSLACLAAVIPLALSIELPKQTVAPAQDAANSITSTSNDFASGSGGSTRGRSSGRPSRPGGGTPGGGGPGRKTGGGL